MLAQRVATAVVVFAGVSWLANSQAWANKAQKIQGEMAVARVSMIDAIRTVESQTGGKVYKAELKEHDGRIYYQIEFVVGNETIKTQVDAVPVPRAVPGARVVPPPGAVIVPTIPAQPPRPAQPGQPAPAPRQPSQAPAAPSESQEGSGMTPPSPLVEPSMPAAPQPTPMPPSGIVIPFDTEPAGNVPAGFVPAETNGTGKLATWKIVADPTAPSQPNDVQVTENPNTNSTFSLLVANQPILANLETSVKVKALGGNEWQGGGLVWRFQDANNYYVAAWSKADNALDVWRVKDGKRKRIGTGAVEGDTAGWHEIRVEMRGDRINAYFDGKKMVSERDFTFADPGKVGFWVMADARTAFDDLTVTEATAGAGK